jgi:hypothetical protein
MAVLANNINEWFFRGIAPKQQAGLLLGWSA